MLDGRLGHGLRLVADDLTGALDAAARFATMSRPVSVCLKAPEAAAGHLAVDSATRERERAEAKSCVARLVRALPPHADPLFYAKLDSLLRGHAGAEIAAWLDAIAFTHCIIAPAFPFQGRVMRGGIQYLRDGSRWRPVGRGLRDDLAREGLSVRLCRPGDAVPPGISLWDAENDDDLADIAAAGRNLSGPVLWCGSGGLAGALTGGFPADTAVALPRPVFGLIGTDHPVMAAQLAACGAARPASVLRLCDGGAADAALVADHLRREGAALAAPDLPAGLARDEAAHRIERIFAALVERLEPPGTLLVSGGETLRGLCRALAANHLDLDGQLLPGIPCSVLRGGRFDGVRVVSKSGAFGDSDLLVRMLELNGLAA